MFFIHGSPSIQGPEAELVKNFIRSNFPTPRNGDARSIFIEPRLGPMKPDIVIVDWNPSILKGWPKDRNQLRDIDLRLAHLIYIEKIISEDRLRVFFPRHLKTCLLRLEKANFVNKVNKLWSLNPLSKIFAIKRITTFEAKISGLIRALEQAYFNTWFASEPYVLISIRKPKENFIKKARLYGIGCWQFSGIEPPRILLRSSQKTIPRSYASWFFNELLWKTQRNDAHEYKH